MAKKIRGVKLQKEEIQKNNGKNISHTISKIKANERYYTTLLVIAFMIIIPISLYFGLRVSSSYNTYAEDMKDEGTGFSYTSRLIYLNEKNIGYQRDNKTSSYSVSLSNMTNNNINYVIRLERDDESIAQCNCEDSIISYDNLRYSLEDRVVRSFTNEDMILTTGNIHPLEREDIPIRLWITDELSKKQDMNYYGRIVVERIEQ